MYISFTMPDSIARQLISWAFDDSKGELKLKDPMVFLTGARQVGKTHLTRQLDAAYYNWDTPEVRKAYLADPYFFRSDSKLVVFDEIHKRRDWKKLLKGYYDSPARTQNFVVTGSGRMDQYQRGGDSLQGRCLSFQLWPFSYDEIFAPRSDAPTGKPRDWRQWQPDSSADDDEPLRKLGGFPAPFLAASEQRLRRWQDQYIERLVREDVRDFSAVHRLDQLDLLARLLPSRVASPLSVQGLCEDVEASPVGVKSWLRLFETLYLGFFVRPFHRKIHRAVKKESKWYFQQWTYVEDPGARFENYLAVQLSLACSQWSEQGRGRYELYYLRDQDRREVDFLIARDLKPVAIIEAKHSPQAWPAGLAYYARKLAVPAFLVYPDGPVRKHEDGLGFSLPSRRLLKGLTAG